MTGPPTVAGQIDPGRRKAMIKRKILKSSFAPRCDWRESTNEGEKLKMRGEDKLRHIWTD